MTTTTAQRGQHTITPADLEQQLQSWHQRWRSDSHGEGTLGQAIAEYADMVDPTVEENGSIVEAEAAGAIFADLRPSEAKRLHELMDAARERAFERSRLVILEELAAAASTFAQEHPDAYRPEPVPAS